MSDLGMFDLSVNHLVGKLITAPKAGGITSVVAPSKKDILLIGPTDFARKDFLILDDRLPFFADDFAFYEGQPVMAVFGPDAESVELYAKEVRIIYNSNQPPKSPDDKTFAITAGEVDSIFNSGSQIFKSEFHVEKYSSTLLNKQRIMANVDEDGKIHIQLASQWPLNVRDVVCRALGVDSRDVVIHCLPYFAPFDELIVFPAIAAAIVAEVAKKTNGLAEMSVSMKSYQPEYHFAISTAVDKDNKPLAQDVEIHIDLGAFPIFTGQIMRALVAGIIPVYEIHAMRIRIYPKASATYPSSFFSDLGYGVALAASEHHFNQLTEELYDGPVNWRINNIGESGIYRKFKRQSLFGKLKETVEKCADKISFSRHYAVNLKEDKMRRSMDPFINYSRGIGIACGCGTQGFSQDFQALSRFSISGFLDAENKLNVLSGMPGNAGVQRLWKGTASSILEIPFENVIFRDINEPDVVDIGPSALSRNIRFIPELLEDLCKQIKVRNLKDAQYPIKASAFCKTYSDDTFFASDSFSTVGVYLHIDTIMLVPVVDRICMNLKIGRIISRRKLLNQLKQTIATSVTEVCPQAVTPQDIEIDFEEDKTKPVGSATSMARGLTIAAMCSALSQATGTKIAKIPVNASDFIETVNSTRKKTK